jgi:hypothetical protein
LREKKADRFWSAPWAAKTEARCGWDAVLARRFFAGVAGDASDIQTGDGKSGQVLVRTLESEKPSQMQLERRPRTTISRWQSRGMQVAPTDDGKSGQVLVRTLKGQKLKPDAVEA